MPDPVWDPDGKARAALNQVVKEYGTRALSSPSVLDNALPDLLPDSPRQTSLIIAASGSNVVASLQERVAEGMDPDTAVRSAATQLAEQTPYDALGCRWVAAEFARALGYQVSETVENAPSPANPVSPTPIAAVTPAAAAAPVVAATPVTPDVAVAPVTPDQAVTAPPASPATRPPAGTGRANRPARRRWTLVVALVVVVGAFFAITGSTGTWPFSSHSVTALPKLLPLGTTKCDSRFSPLKGAEFAGVTAMEFCDVNAIDGVVIAYQFDNESDYAASLSSFNRIWRFNPASATSGCPSPSGKQGETGWYSGSNGLYPKRSGQELECFSTTISGKGSEIFPFYIWTVPSEYTYLQAIGSTGTTMSQLDRWWGKNGGPFNR